MDERLELLEATISWMAERPPSEWRSHPGIAILVKHLEENHGSGWPACQRESHSPAFPINRPRFDPTSTISPWNFGTSFTKPVTG